MVAIRRKRNSPGNTPASLLTVRNAIIAVIVIQGIRFLFGGSSSATTAGNSNNNRPATGSNPVQDALKDSRTNLKGGSKNAGSLTLKEKQALLDQHYDRLKKAGHVVKPPPAIVEEDSHHEHDQHHEKPRLQNKHDHEQDDHPDQPMVDDDEKPGEVDLMEHIREDKAKDEHKDEQQQQQPKQPVGDSAEVKNDASTDMVLTKLGSGPTKVGYVVDLAHERNNPTYRNAALELVEGRQAHHADLEKTIVQELLKGKVSSVHACETVVTAADVEQQKRLQLDPKCHDADTRLVAYNGADFARNVCGHVLEPHSAMVLEEDCHLLPGGAHHTLGGDDTWQPPPIHLLPHDVPPVSGHGMPAIQVVSKPPSAAAAASGQVGGLEKVDCDIECEWEPKISGMDRYIVGTPWKVTWTDEDPASQRSAQMERTDYRHDHYYATTSWRSSVPLSFFSFDKYDFRKAPAIDFDAADNAASSVLDAQCAYSIVRRQKWMAAAQANMNKVHFYGSCQHNTEVPNGLSLKKKEDRIELMKKDRIVLAYEASTEKYHVTEIVWEALMSGAVPAILGASNLDGDILPHHAALYGANYNSWDEFSKFVQSVADSREKWESYQAWRNDEAALTTLERRLNFTRTPPQCRLCRWAYAKKYGLGWDHEQQAVRANHIEKKFCLSNDQKVVTQPFRESWHEHDDDKDDFSAVDVDESCQATFSTMESLGFERRVWHHDGFTDMILVAKEGEDGQPQPLPDTVVLRLHFASVRNYEGAMFRDVHTLVPDAARSPFVSSAAIQDEQSKVTVLANFVTATKSSRSPAPGWLEIVIPLAAAAATASPFEELKLRIITEDFNVLHDKLTEYYPSSYGKMAMKDFIDPLELFYVAS